VTILQCTLEKFSQPASEGRVFLPDQCQKSKAHLSENFILFNTKFL